MGKRRKIRIGIIIFWIILVIQFIFSKSIVEPYPAIVFPGFKNVLSTTENITFTGYEAYLYTNKDSIKVEKGDLLGKVPDRFRRFAINSIIKRQENIIRKKKINLGNYTFIISQSHREDSFKTKNFVIWLEDNIRSLFPEEIHKLRFFEVQYTYNIEDKSLNSSRKSKAYFNLEKEDL